MIRYAIRKADVAEMNTFKELWEEYMLESIKDSLSEGLHNIDAYLNAFLSISADPTKGVAVFAEETDDGVVGGLLWGSPSPFVDTSKFGKVALGWGTYVRSGHRGRKISTGMRDFASKELTKVGYTSVIGAVHLGNQAGQESVLHLGFVPYQTCYVLDLRR